MSTNRTATLTIDGKTVEFPVMVGTHGQDVIDIRSLGAKTGLFTYDSGFLSTASCQSKVTFIDGDKGELLYRGYPIEQLAEQCNFLEVAWLLKNGEVFKGMPRWTNLPEQQRWQVIAYIRSLNTRGQEGHK